MIKDRHIGRFSISLDLIDDHPLDVVKILKGMIVLRAEVNLVTNSVDYTAISSKHFRKVGMGREAPIYTVEIISSSGKVGFL